MSMQLRVRNETNRMKQLTITSFCTSLRSQSCQLSFHFVMTQFTVLHLQMYSQSLYAEQNSACIFIIVNLLTPAN